MTEATVAKTARKPRAAKAVVEGEAVAKVAKQSKTTGEARPRASRAKKVIVAPVARKVIVAPHVAAAAMLGVSASAIRYGAPRR